MADSSLTPFEITFVNTKTAHAQMRELMRKWFSVDSMSEIDMYIREGAQVRFPIRRIHEHMVRDGKRNIKIRRFIDDHDVEERLRRDPALAELETDELIRRLSAQ